MIPTVLLTCTLSSHLISSRFMMSIKGSLPTALYVLTFKHSTSYEELRIFPDLDVAKISLPSWYSGMRASVLVNALRSQLFYSKGLGERVCWLPCCRLIDAWPSSVLHRHYSQQPKSFSPQAELWPLISRQNGWRDKLWACLFFSDSVLCILCHWKKSYLTGEYMIYA